MVFDFAPMRGGFFFVMNYQLEDLNGEVWETIPLFTDYQASSLGRIKSVKRLRIGSTGGFIRERIMRYQFNKTTGYYVVILRKDKKPITRTTHVIIASTFLGERPTGLDVNHKDGNKLNNCADNLEYTTRLENIHHAFRNGLTDRKGVKNGGAKMNDSRVLDMRLRHSMGASIKDLSMLFNLSYTATKEIVRNVSSFARHK